MPFRASSQPNFETLIEDLFATEERQFEAPKPPHQFSIDSLEAAWELAANSRATPRPTVNSGGGAPLPFYGYDGAEVAREVSLDPGEIFNELGLHPHASEADVAALRRQFALRNHPDRVPAELRDVATQRMMIANDLMDRYVAKLQKQGT
jgi:hypothetical protein